MMLSGSGAKIGVLLLGFFSLFSFDVAKVVLCFMSVFTLIR